MFSRVMESVLVGLVTAIAIAALTVAWNWASSGGAIRALGGVTKAEVDDIVKASSSSSLAALVAPLEAGLKNANEKLSFITYSKDGVSISTSGARYDFPANGNMNISLPNGIVCFAANDRSRPNTEDLKKCF